MDGFHGSLLRGSVSAAKVGERIGHDFLQAVYPAQRAAQIRHMLGCFASGFMCHAPQIDGGAWFEIRIVGKVAILVEGNLNVGSVSPRHFEIFLIRQGASCTPFVLFFQRWAEIEFSGEPFERFSSEDSQQIFSLIHIGPPFRLRLPLLSVKSTRSRMLFAVHRPGDRCSRKTGSCSCLSAAIITEEETRGNGFLAQACQFWDEFRDGGRT